MSEVILLLFSARFPVNELAFFMVFEIEPFFSSNIDCKELAETKTEAVNLFKFSSASSMLFLVFLFNKLFTELD